jgi:sulfoxide reductase heme-binding subunit YedZ
MSKKILIYNLNLVCFALILTSYIATLLLALFLKPAPIANVIGFLTLVTYITTLLPSILKTIFPILRGNNLLTCLLKNRRYLGITAFVLGLDHGLLMTIQKQINFLDWHTYINYFQGISMLTILTVLAITSNDWSMKVLKKNGKNCINLLIY